MRWFRKRKTISSNIFEMEDRVRRALAEGHLSPENISFYLDLAEQRRKPADLVHTYRILEQANGASFPDKHRLSVSMARQDEKRKLWASKAGAPLRIAMFHIRDWHARLCEGVANLAGDELVLRTNDEKALVSANPDAVISSYIAPDTITRMRALLPDTFWLYLRHGIANKRSSFGIAGAFDAVCVSSRYVADFYCRKGFFPSDDVWITGYPPLDRLPRSRATMLAGDKTILYAPTFNPGLSSAASFGIELLENMLAADRRLRLVVKLHPETLINDRQTWERYRNACRQLKRAAFVEDRETDLISLFDQIDILVSDFSSSAFLFLATGRPIIFLTPRDAFDSHEWRDPEGIEWKWRGMAEEVRNLSELKPVLRKILGGRDDYAAARAKYRKLLFDDSLDGHSAARVMQRLGQVFGRNPD